MNASALLAKTQKFFVESGLGASTIIEYRYEDGTIIPALNVFASELDINKIKTEKSTAEATLTNVFLDKEPSQNDRIRFANSQDVWRVQSWSNQDGSYILNIAFKRYRV